MDATILRKSIGAAIALISLRSLATVGYVVYCREIAMATRVGTLLLYSALLVATQRLGFGRPLELVVGYCYLLAATLAVCDVCTTGLRNKTITSGAALAVGFV